MLMKILLAGCGGFLGAGLRYTISATTLMLVSETLFPLGTFIANMLGCLLAGGLFCFTTHKLKIPADLSVMLFTGFLGGLTTFSTLCLEVFHLIRANHAILGLSLILVQSMLGVLAIYFGFRIVAHFVLH